MPLAIALASLLATTSAPRVEGTAVLVMRKGLNEHFSVDFDASGRTFIVEMGGHRVSVLEPDGTLRVLAGTGQAGLTGDDGPASDAQLNGPHHLLVGSDRALYIADTFNN